MALGAALAATGGEWQKEKSLLMKYLQMRSRWSWSMSNLIAAFRVCMFAHKDLWGWLDDPTAKKAPKPRRGYGLFSG